MGCSAYKASSISLCESRSWGERAQLFKRVFAGERAVQLAGDRCLVTHIQGRKMHGDKETEHRQEELMRPKPITSSWSLTEAKKQQKAKLPRAGKERSPPLTLPRTLIPRDINKAREARLRSDLSLRWMGNLWLGQGPSDGVMQVTLGPRMFYRGRTPTPDFSCFFSQVQVSGWELPAPHHHCSPSTGKFSQQHIIILFIHANAPLQGVTEVMILQK